MGIAFSEDSLLQIFQLAYVPFVKDSLVNFKKKTKSFSSKQKFAPTLPGLLIMFEAGNGVSGT